MKLKGFLLAILFCVNSFSSFKKWGRTCSNLITFSAIEIAAQVAPDSLAEFLLSRHVSDRSHLFEVPPTQLDLSRRNLSGIELLRLSPHFSALQSLLLAHNPILKAGDIVRALKEVEGLKEVDVSQTWNGRDLLRVASHSFPNLKKLRMSQVRNYDLEALEKAPNLSLLDFHDSSPNEGVVFWGGLTLRGLTRFLQTPQSIKAGSSSRPPLRLA